MRLAGLLLAMMFGVGAGSPYEAEAAKWRADYEESLKAPDGWLSVAGLSWLHAGENTAGSDAKCDVVLPKTLGAHVGTITLKADKAVLHTAAGEQTLTAEKASVATGGVTLALIERNKRYAIRVRDPNAETRAKFTGTKWFPLDESYRVQAKWVPSNPPRKIAIASIIGYSEEQDSPGYAEFQLHGKTFRLEPIVEDDTLFFMFKDETARHETYGAGRFLNTAQPKDGMVTLDFNYAHNPPCAFTAYATCPLPPKQNVLATRIEAGELRYGNH